MVLLKLIPEKTDFKFIRLWFMAFVLSAILAVGSVIAFFSLGLNFGIDFRGGTLLQVRTTEPADLSQMRSAIGGLGLGDVKVQEFGTPFDTVIIVEGEASLDESVGPTTNVEAAAQKIPDLVMGALKQVYGDGIKAERRESVGPKISGELVTSGILAVVVAVGLMLVYIWFRFEWQFSLGAILALVHDVVLTIGMFAVTQLEFNLSIIAAILTIVGYSMNDTVVVYDRVRENLRKFKKMDLADLLDLSINSTLSRTVMTSVTTLLALFALFFFGGEVIHGFTFAMIWGVFVGTYSSIFIAAPLLLLTDVKRDWSGEKSKTVAKA